MRSVKFQDADREKATECVAKLRAGIENCCPEGILLSRVEQRHVEQCTGKESGLDKPNEESGEYETSKALNRRHTGGDDTPDGHGQADVHARITDFSDYHIRWDLHEDWNRDVSRCRLSRLAKLSLTIADEE